MRKNSSIPDKCKASLLFINFSGIFCKSKDTIDISSSSVVERDEEAVTINKVSKAYFDL